MADANLQQLIDRIRSEAVAVAQTQAAEILGRAKEQAAATMKGAQSAASAVLAQAEHDAKAFRERSARALQQTARDLVLRVGQGIEEIVAGVVAGVVHEALRPEVVERMLIDIAAAYVARGVRERRVELLLAPQDREHFVRFFKEQMHMKLAEGVEVHVDKRIGRGFKIRLAEQHVYHDFTEESIAETLASLLRPELAEIVHRAAAAVGTEKDHCVP